MEFANGERNYAVRRRRTNMECDGKLSHPTCADILSAEENEIKPFWLILCNDQSARIQTLSSNLRTTICAAT